METNEDQGAVRRERRGQVEVLTLSYPARRNAVSMRMRAELLEALTAILADDGCRAVVLTGDGAHFCSGGDITSFAGVTPAAGRQRMFRIHQILRLLIAEAHRFPALVDEHDERCGTPIMEHLRQRLEEGANRGEIRSAGSLDYPQIILGPALSLSVIMLLFSDRKPVDVERYFEAHVDLVLNGLLPRNGEVS